MKKILYIITMTLALSGAANAIEVQVLKLKDGSVLNGYVYKQNGTDLIEFKSDNATICKPSKDVVAISEIKPYKIKELDKQWKEWSKKNKDQLGGSEEEPTIDLCDITLASGKVVEKVRVLEQGVNIIYCEATPNTYSVKWNDIERIDAPKRANDLLSGIDVSYKLKSGVEYIGQYAGETYEMLSLYVDGKPKQSMNIMDVVKYSFKPHNPEQSIFEQSSLLDIIKSRSGSNYVGIITEKNYSTGKDSEDYFVIETKDDGSKKVMISDITELLKTENKEYKPIKDIVLKNDQVLINRKEAKYVKVTEKNDVLTLEDCDKAITLKMEKGKKLSVDVEFSADASEKVNFGPLIKVDEVKSKRKSIFSFTYANLGKSGILPKSTTVSRKNILKSTYEIASPGVYALYNAQSNKAITFVVE